jgi:hypothetical protein
MNQIKPHRELLEKAVYPKLIPNYPEAEYAIYARKAHLAHLYKSGQFPGKYCQLGYFAVLSLFIFRITFHSRSDFFLLISPLQFDVYLFLISIHLWSLIHTSPCFHLVLKLRASV